jgi:hypothetical protein
VIQLSAVNKDFLQLGMEIANTEVSSLISQSEITDHSRKMYQTTWKLLVAARPDAFHLEEALLSHLTVLCKTSGTMSHKLGVGLWYSMLPAVAFGVPDIFQIVLQWLFVINDYATWQELQRRVERYDHDNLWMSGASYQLFQRVVLNTIETHFWSFLSIYSPDVTRTMTVAPETLTRNRQVQSLTRNILRAMTVEVFQYGKYVDEAGKEIEKTFIRLIIPFVLRHLDKKLAQEVLYIDLDKFNHDTIPFYITASQRWAADIEPFSKIYARQFAMQKSPVSTDFQSPDQVTSDIYAIIYREFQQVCAAQISEIEHNLSGSQRVKQTLSTQERKNLESDIMKRFIRIFNENKVIINNLIATYRQKVIEAEQKSRAAEQMASEQTAKQQTDAKTELDRLTSRLALVASKNYSLAEQIHHKILQEVTAKIDKQIADEKEAKTATMQRELSDTVGKMLEEYNNTSEEVQQAVAKISAKYDAAIQQATVAESEAADRLRSNAKENSDATSIKIKLAQLKTARTAEQQAEYDRVNAVILRTDKARQELAVMVKEKKDALADIQNKKQSEIGDKRKAMIQEKRKQLTGREVEDAVNELSDGKGELGKPYKTQLLASLKAIDDSRLTRINETFNKENTQDRQQEEVQLYVKSLNEQIKMAAETLSGLQHRAGQIPSEYTESRRKEQQLMLEDLQTQIMTLIKTAMGRKTTSKLGSVVADYQVARHAVDVLIQAYKSQLLDKRQVKEVKAVIRDLYRKTQDASMLNSVSPYSALRFSS